ncbi:4Fe-4S dicluster protein [Aliiruegeria haliotis]|uniref:4Fe-4S dicluster protein n=1 Tax=Aliiruegeria haliotis TaxID=1280846 RepID=A0A2T0RPG2_9RHOB|nr:4Fe-4S binding protein [Aliiruegeria haliotis]PRY23084.1 4Fe-4S dicluster protein [Aliiruegeria haliotis]
MAKSLITCSCLDSQSIDSKAFEGLDGVRCVGSGTALCTREITRVAELLQEGDTIVACGQEQDRFEELAADLGVETPQFVDLRDRAGWSDEGDAAAPKMAALLSDALLVPPPVKTFDIVSEGICLVIGGSEAALSAAVDLCMTMGVTLLIDEGQEPPLQRGFDVISGRLRSAAGALGKFDIGIDNLRQVEPGGRGAFRFGEPRSGARSACDVILDLRPAGTAPLFPAPEKRDGYLRADPGSPAAVARAVAEAAQLVGTFEKPLYLSLDPLICAHSRAGQEGCRNCLDICPTGAISPAGDHVVVDPLVCAGCGACAALCPSGAITYDDPSATFLFGRMRTLSESFRNAGGKAPRLLVHDREHGAEMISLAARFERGLPADVIPMDLERVSGFGHAEMLAALACGFAAVDILVNPKTEREALERELTLAQALADSPDRLRLLDPIEPAGLCDAVYGREVGAPVETPVLALGSRRQVARLAAQALHPGAEQPLPLPQDAPYGAVLVDTEACTLCLSCASLCPAGALGDNPDMPQLRFQEDACLQCGLCAHVCPEDAITLAPRMDLSDAALSQKVLHEEEPAACVECGKLFGVKSTIEKIAAKLEGKHSMFATGDAARMIRMCDDCRVQAQYHSENNPFAAGERPRVRTTDDYFSKRRDH